MSESLRAAGISEFENAKDMWQEVVEAAPDAWLWHTWVALQFNLVAGQKFEAKDHSFFVFKDDELVGVVPLVIQKKSYGDFEGLDATYYSGFLPWPCFKGEHSEEERNVFEDFAFEELERRAKAHGAGHIRVRRVPPTDAEDEAKRIERVAIAHGYIHFCFYPSIIHVTPDVFSHVRDRYQRYYKKFSPEFDLTIAEGSGMTPELEETYFNLHVKDAGGQFRSRESYAKQADTARYGEGFYVVAREKASGVVAGMLLVSLYHGVALDNSVAIDPDYADKRVGHLVRWKALEEVLERNVSVYEIGHQKINIPALQRLVTAKDVSIAHFKDGWARGAQRERYEIEKFLDEKFLHAYMQERESALKEYFKIK